MRLIIGASISLALLFGACDLGVDEVGLPDATPTPSAGIALTRCENPEGFALGYPEEWHTNSGDVVPLCSQFNPDPFEVPRGTDERVAAITAWIDPVSFERASAPREGRDEQRRDVVIGGRDGLRLEYNVGRHSIWPEGTPITVYMVPLEESSGGRARTLFVDTVALPDFDYERNQEILERMVATLELTD